MIMKNGDGLLSNFAERQKRAIFVLFKLFIGSGIQWLFGVISYFFPHDNTLASIFIVLDSSHGIFVLIGTLLLRPLRKRMIDSIKKVQDRFSPINKVTPVVDSNDIAITHMRRASTVTVNSRPVLSTVIKELTSGLGR